MLDNEPENQKPANLQNGYKFLHQNGVMNRQFGGNVKVTVKHVST